jgi:hypothetical protein
MKKFLVLPVLPKMAALLIAFMAIGSLFAGCNNDDGGGETTLTEFPAAWVGTWKSPGDSEITITKTTVTYRNTYEGTETSFVLKSITFLSTEFGIDMYQVETTTEAKPGVVDVYQFEYIGNTVPREIGVIPESGTTFPRIANGTYHL